jgi:hypothetical protein
MFGVNVLPELTGGRDRLSPANRTSSILSPSSSPTVSVSPPSTPKPVQTKSVSLHVDAANIPSVPTYLTSDVGVEYTAVAPSTPNVNFSLTQGALSITGLVNSTTVVTQPDTETTVASNEALVGSLNQANADPFDNTSVVANDVQPHFSPVETSSAIDEQKPFSGEGDKVDSDTQPIFAPVSGKPDDKSDSTSDKADSAAKAMAVEQQVLAQLAKRDAEVRSHEQAHASVGGSFAQSPQLSYEQGSDGRRYAVDGEVSIDISAVPGNPLATVNKMRQVYAAAMAPSDPSMADIRVAAEAIRILNMAKADLAEQRLQNAPSVEEMAPLLGAESAIEGIPAFEPINTSIAGDVSEDGSITVSQSEEVNPVADTIDKINSQLALQARTLESGSTGYSSDTISDRYLPTSKATSSFSFSV